MSQEEMQSAVLAATRALGLTSEAIALIENPYEPMSDSYMGMGTRRREIFENTFVNELKGVVSRDDIVFARKVFEADGEIRSQWNTMVGE